ncbi:MAG TPA: TlpA disulfide reductase family protein [Pirellulales bacterium]|jgi:peroxiredoxin|nr:TlpA disulfide reductase family protein [Pirellulales bacterium]
MLRYVLLALWLVALPTAAAAQNRFLPFGGLSRQKAKSTASSVSAAEQEYEQLVQQSKAADEKYQLRLDQLKDDRSRAEFSKQKPDFSRPFEELAERDRASPVGLKALVWLCRFGAQQNAGKYIDLILQDYLDTEQLVDAIRATAPYAGRVEAARTLYRAALAKSPHREVRGLACYYLAYSCVPEPDFGAIAPEREREAVALLERVIQEYGDVPSYRGPLGALATGGLTAIEHLKVGKQAPPIQGRDLKGRKMKLSDYRGQVVVVTFWADWCGPCHAELPYHRALVEKFADRPFALLGVNGDPPDKLKQIISHEKITWPSWADGPAGPISASWSVGMWPTTYVIDSRGRVRYRAVSADRLEPLVAGLLREMGPAGDERAAAR